MNGILKISDQDAGKFLQGQLTCDVTHASQTPILGAHCNREGRVISLFYLYHINDAFYLIMDNRMVAITQASLKKYAVFFKVILEDVTSSNPAEITFTSDETLIKQGIPVIYPETSGQFLPHDLNLHVLNGISFDKGCYTGQEIIARMHYRGKLKTFLQPVYFKSNTLYHPGEELACGTVVNSTVTSEQDHIGLIVTTEEKKDNDENITHRTCSA
jgi:folate-binding protein YgfZ